MKKSLILLMSVTFFLSTFKMKGEEVVINLLHLSDTHSNIHPGGGRDENLVAKKGGLARAASVIGMIKQEDPDALLLHSGDIFVGDLTWYLFYGVPEIAVLKQLGVDAITIGNHEFDATTPNLVSILENAEKVAGDVNYLSANLIAGEGDYGVALKNRVKDYIIKDVKGIKIGIFGMTSAVANLTSMPNPDIIVSDEYLDIAEAQVSALKSEGCQLIIFLSHLGMNADIFIAENVPGINFILGGHDHLLTHFPYEHSFIIHSGKNYQNIGHLELKFENGLLKEWKSYLVDLDETIPEEPSTKQFIENLIDSQDEDVQALFKVQIGHAAGFFEESVPEPNEAGIKSTNIGCLVSNAFKEWGGTEIGFTTSGLTSQPLFEGALIGNDVFRVLGYGVNETTGVGYNMAKFKLRGDYLYQCIAYALSIVCNDNDDEFLPQLSGIDIIYYTEDCSLGSVMVNGEPLDLERHYTITSSIFIWYYIAHMLEFPVEDTEIFNEVTDFMVLLNYVIDRQVLVPAIDGCKNVIAPVQNSNNQNLNSNSLKAYPNPANYGISIEAEIKNSGIYSIDIFDLVTLKETHIGSQYLSAGTEIIPINIASLPSGNYLLRLKNETNTLMTKFVIVR